MNTEQKPALKPWESRRISKEEYEEYMVQSLRAEYLNKHGHPSKWPDSADKQIEIFNKLAGLESELASQVSKRQMAILKHATQKNANGLVKVDSVRTGTDGRYRFKGLVPREYTVFSLHHRYVWQIEILLDQSTNLDLGPFNLDPRAF